MSSEISMRDLFPSCVNVLNSKRYPIHYKTLTDLAMIELGIPRPKEHADFDKNAENVREKLLQSGQRNTFYTGSPLYAGALSSWFVSDAKLQLSLTMDYIQIPGSAQAGADGAFEALMRSAHMVVHNQHLANTERLNRVRSSGLVLEKHISHWFKRNYPEFYSDAENQGKWKEACSHDFCLTVDNRRFLIDIAGPDSKGLYGKRGIKHPTDLHFTCKISEDFCFWEGVVRGEGFKPSIDPGSIFSPTAFLVWLNCAKHGIKYSDLTPKLLKAA
jgi:hypothetical protein